MTHNNKAPSNMSSEERGIRNEERLCQIDEKWVAHATVHDLEAKALQLQHVEYERRLEALNHENARILAQKAEFATREAVEGLTREVTQKIDRNTELLAAALPREVYDERHEALASRVKEVEQTTLPREVFDSSQKEVVQRAEALSNTVILKPSKQDHDALAERVKQIEDWKNKAMGAAVILTLASGAIGAAIATAFGG